MPSIGETALIRSTTGCLSLDAFIGLFGVRATRPDNTVGLQSIQKSCGKFRETMTHYIIYRN